MQAKYFEWFLEEPAGKFTWFFCLKSTSSYTKLKHKLEWATHMEFMKRNQILIFLQDVYMISFLLRVKEGCDQRSLAAMVLETEHVIFKIGAKIFQIYHARL